jgi:hypothetical protein
VEIVETDLLELTVHGRFVKLLQGDTVVEEPEEELVTEVEAEVAVDSVGDVTEAEMPVAVSAPTEVASNAPVLGEPDTATPATGVVP